MGRFRRERVLASAAVLCGLALLCLGGGRTAAFERTARPGSAPRRPVAVFGIDAGDWAVIDPLVARGALPTFARLKRVGALGVLKADPPLLSPIIWTTMATGRRPEDHGVLDFLVDLPGGGIAPANSGARRVKAMWEIWSNANRPVLVTGWWATWPADHVRGAIVSDRVALPHLRLADSSSAGLVFPPDRWPEISRLRVTSEQIDVSAVRRFVPVSDEEFSAAAESERTTSGLYRDRIAHLRAAIAATRSYERASTALIASVRPDLWAVYYELVDTTSHLFAQDRRSHAAISAAYVEMDHALEEAAAALPTDTVLVVASDHGFYPADAGIREDPADLTSGATAWHRPAGIVAVTTAGALRGQDRAPARPSAAVLGVVSPLDILPTLLACAGLPAARDMAGRALPVCDAPSVPAIATYGAHEQQTAASSLRDATPAEVERLRALGYVAGNGAPSSLARVNLGEILFRKGDYAGALRELQPLVRADPLNVRATLWLARALAAAGRADDAVRQYDRLIQGATAARVDVDPLVFLAATDLDLQQQRIDAAVARLRRVPPARARAPEVLVALGAVAEARRDSAGAEREYRRALEVAPADSEALERLVDLLVRTAHAPDAYLVAAPLARRYASSAIHVSLAGETLLAQQRYVEAEQYFAKALALQPDAASIRIELARARLLAGRPAGALEALAPVEATSAVETIRAAALARQGDWTGAAAAYEHALSDAPATVDLLNGLGYAQLQCGRKAQAAATFERSLQMKADQPDIRKLLEQARR
jgi:tetratricopeptide (TPR) repeat protein